MYAVIQTGGKQYRVAEGETLRVEKLLAVKGDKVAFDALMLADDAGGVQIGTPKLPGIKVEAEILEQGLGAKITIFKYKRRKSIRKKSGHRQPFTSLKITSIKVGA